MNALSTNTVAELPAQPVRFSAAFNRKAPAGMPPESGPRHSTKLDAALDCAGRGFAVFPLIPNSKKPLIENWQNLATTDESAIRKCWSEDPGRNIGIVTQRLLVVDVDPRNGGDINFQTLVLVEDFPKTLRSTTQGGGDHVIYALPDNVFVRGGKDKLGRGIDIKSYGGYIVAPGSTIDGKPYAWGNQRAPAMAPQWLINHCKAPIARSESAGKRVVAEDAVAIDMALQWFAQRAPTAELGTLNDTAFRVAAKLFDFGVTAETCTEMLREWGDACCSPRLEDDTIAHVVNSAARNRTQAIGVSHPLASGFEPYEMPARAAPSIPAAPQEDKRLVGYEAACAYIYNEAPDESDIPDQDKAAVVVANYLRPLKLSGHEIVTLMQDWSIASYGRELDLESLYHAAAEADRQATPSVQMPLSVPAALPPAGNTGVPVAPAPADVPIAAPKTTAVAPRMAEALAHKAAQSAKDGWRDPVNLWADVPAPAALPLDAVPDVISRSAQDRARRLGVTPAAPAAALITTMGALVPAGNQLQMRQNDPDWLVKAILWTMIIGAPGTNKSATISSAVAPARNVQAAWHKRYSADLRVHEAQKAAQKERNGNRKPDKDPEVANTEAPTLSGGAVSGQTTADDIFAGMPVAESRPRFRQKIANDATTEALAEMLADNPDGIYYVADELAGLFGSMDTYRPRGGKDRPFWLSAKDGGAHAINRKTSDRILIENCAISVLGGIQPDKIRKLAAGLSEDGMLQRFAPVFLERRGNGEDIHPDTELNETVARVASMIAGAADGAVFKFAPEADTELREIEAFKAREIAKPNAAPSLRQWLDKLPNEYGRVSLAFHFIEWASSAAGGERPPDIVHIETARRARRYLTEFVYSHARAFYEQIGAGSGAGDHGLWIAGYILARGMGSIDAREIYRAYHPLRAKDRRDEIARVMQDLEMLDWVRTTKIKNNVPTEWAVNPAVQDGRFAAIAEAERLRRGEVVKGIRDREAQTGGAA